MKRKSTIEKALENFDKEQSQNLDQYTLGWKAGFRYALKWVLKN